MADAKQVAAGLTKGAARACRSMTSEWQFPGKATFDANGAWNLYWARTGLGKGAIAQMQDTPITPGNRKTRLAYRLTPFGLEVRAVLERNDHD